MQNKWQEFVEQEISFFKPILNNMGFEIDQDQPHTKGERGAFRAKKIILLGERKNDKLKVVIKCARFEEGKNEILQEKKARENLSKVDFAYHEFSEPKEIYFYNGLAPSPLEGEGRGEVVIQITEFILENTKFLDRDPKDQFNLAYRSFVTQEGIHAVTAKHNKLIKKLFNTFDFNIYRRDLFAYKGIILNLLINVETDALGPLVKGAGERSVDRGILDLAETQFLKNKHRISQFCGFLTHTDFVPHNFRVRNDNGVERVYLLDHSAILIGNKHDGWARFLNFCVLHSPLLEKWFLEYFKVNRSIEENESLRLMRIYRLFELMAHHSTIYKNTESLELKELSQKRVLFWLELLKAVFEDRELEREIIEDYKSDRDKLRSQSEKERQSVIY